MIQLLWCSFGEFGIGSINNPLIYIFLYSHHLPAWYCIDIVKRNSVLVSYGSYRVNWKVHQSYRQVLCIALLKNPLAHNHFFFFISLKGSFSSNKVFFIKWKYLSFWTILQEFKIISLNELLGNIYFSKWMDYSTEFCALWSGLKPFKKSNKEVCLLSYLSPTFTNCALNST